MLGQILARSARLSYDDLIAQRILDPLGMNDTVVAGSAATRRYMAPAFEYGGAPTQPQSFGAFAPAVSMESDLKDMMTFLQANLNAPQGTLGRALAFAQQERTPVPEWNMAMGLGWQTVLPPTHRTPGSLGDLPSGWVEKGGGTDGYASFIGLNHQSNSGFVAMTNVSDDDFQDVIAHAISPSTDKMPVLWALAKKEPSPLSGTYVTEINGNQGKFDIFKFNGDLYVWIPAVRGGPAKLSPLGANRYLWNAPGVTFKFNTDNRGRVTGLGLIQNRETMLAKKIR